MLTGNLVRFATVLAVFTALQWFAAINARLFEPVPPAVLWSGVAFLYALVGAIAYIWFSGRGLVRFLLVLAIPVLSNLILMLVLENPGYSGLMVLLIVPYAVAFSIGAGIASWVRAVATRKSGSLLS